MTKFIWINVYETIYTYIQQYLALLAALNMVNYYFKNEAFAAQYDLFNVLQILL